MTSSCRGLLLLLPCLVGCQARSGLPACEIAEPLGRVVQTSSNEVRDAEPWSLSEIWRAGGLDEGAAPMMLPTSARVRTDGTLAIADFQSGDVWLLGPDGQWLEPVAGRGQGPGELLSPLATAWTPAGDLLALDAAQSKLERYDLALRISETVRLPPDLLGPVLAAGQVGWFGLQGDGSAYVELPSTTSPENTIQFARARPGASGREVLWTAEYPDGLVPALDLPARPEWPRALLGVGPDGWVVAPRSDRYELLVHGEDDRVRLHLCVEEDERVRRDADGPPPDDPWVGEILAQPPSGTEALFARIQVDHDGRIWIMRDLPRAGDGFDQVLGVAGARFDVISPNGAFLARVRLPESLRFQDARGDTIWAFAVGALQEVDVVAARIRRNEAR